MLDIDIELPVDMEVDVGIELAGLIDEPIPRLEPALLLGELGTQHSARLERQNNEKVCNTYFGTLANRTPPWNEEPPTTAVRGTHTDALAV